MDPSSEASSLAFSDSNSNRLSDLWKRVTGKSQKAGSPPAACSEPGLSRASSPSSGLIRRVSRKVVPNLPRTKTFRRQQSEDRDKLQAIHLTADERRAASVDRRLHLPRGASRSSTFPPRASAPDFFDDADLARNKLGALSQSVSASQSPVEEKQFLSLDNISTTNLTENENLTEEQIPINVYPETLSDVDARSEDASQYDAMIRDELETKWILNLSMHFRDGSKREKFFVTFRQTDVVWRRVTISIDYRGAPADSLERDLLDIKYQRQKSAKIYEAIRESLKDIQFYDTVTNLKLQTDQGRLHVHVVEDVNEIITYPSTRAVHHLGCRRVRESEVEFESHMSGFVYKVRVKGLTLIKKEIPGPQTIDEFLYEVTALHSVRNSNSIIEFYGVVVDDDDDIIKGLLISFAERGTLVDVLYDSRESEETALPWDVREKWARQIIQGLSDLHEAGFVQGDFTLSNIVIDEFGDAKIIDINRRGCPVGWEPPEIAPIIDSGLRVSMYIGVKSDLYQLGMVLWALATTDDEPEARPRPLRLKDNLDVPLWYRKVVGACLHENPRARMPAAALLSVFPEMACEEADERRVPPSIDVDEGTPSNAQDATDGKYEPQISKTVEHKSSVVSSTASNTQVTSPSFSGEPSYPSRGRSPPSPWPRHRGLYSLPYTDRNAMWAGSHDAADVDGRPTAELLRAGNLGELGAPVVVPKEMSMEEELEQMAAELRAEPGLENEQTQPTGGKSQEQDKSGEIAVAVPLAMDGGHDEQDVLLGEDEATVLTPTNDSTSSENSDDTPVAEISRPNNLAMLPTAVLQKDVDLTEELVGDGVHAVVPAEEGRTE
ncbi:hypothetical protein F5Y17DRAFT_456068 [Xylariaceae sp. FL0594]|nr:hypothetical protein F5Y17DRAFT_456068 [Xylariaceae sp. FL0594]